MAIKYIKAYDLRKIAEEIVEKLSWNHIFLEHVAFIRSFGSKSRGTIARCHAMGKAMQIGMNREKGFYLIEVISERFDKMSEDEKIKTIIHELMHIPKSFGGGFKHHNIVNEKSVKNVYEHYVKLKQEELKENKKWF
tara:strand:+ start:103 stop:513 length:411 start_codon:yes stop_codon:yes gene_type:complete